MTTLEHYPAQIAEHVTDTCDAEGCRALWWAVIEQTAKDIAYLERFRGSGELAKHELERVRRIEEWPPGEFVEDDWFGVVCEYVGLPAEGVRGWLGVEGGGDDRESYRAETRCDDGRGDMTSGSGGAATRKDAGGSRFAVEPAPGARQYPDPPDAELWDIDGRIYHEDDDGNLHEGRAEGCGECAA